MDEIIAEMPIGVTVEFASGKAADADVFRMRAAFLAPSEANLGGELRDIFIIFEVRPKFYLGARLLFKKGANYGDGRSNVTP